MAEVTIKLTGQDNLSNTIKKVKQEVNGMKDAVNNIDAANLKKINEKFESTINSGKSVNTQLSQIKKQITEMNYKGLDGTPEFQKMIAKAKELQAAIDKTKKDLGSLSQSGGNGNSGGGFLSGISSGLEKLTGINLSGIQGQFSSITEGISGFSGKLGISTELLGKFTIAGTAIVAVGTAIYKITDAWMDYNEKLQEATNKTKAFTGLSGSEMQNVRNQVLAIVDVYGGDFDETMKTANSLVKTYGLSWEEAFKLIQDGYNTGANANGDMLDQLSEYSKYMKQAGVSAEEMVSILQTGVTNGVFNDKALDSIKEGDLRIREMGNSTKEALTGIGIDADKMTAQLSAGSITTMDAMKQISDAMKNVAADSPEMQAAISDIFGGPGEDAGREYLTMLSQIPTTMEAAKQANADYVSGMERQVEATTNLKNSFSSLFDFTDSGFQNVKATMLESVYEPTTQIMNAFADSDSIQSFGDLIKEVFSYCVDVFKDLYSAVGDVIEFILDLVDNFGALSVSTDSLTVVIKGQKIIWDTIVAVWNVVVGVITQLINYWKQLNTQVNQQVAKIPLLETLKSGIETVISWIKQAIAWWEKLLNKAREYKEEQQSAGSDGKPKQKTSGNSTGGKTNQAKTNQTKTNTQPKNTTSNSTSKRSTTSNKNTTKNVSTKTVIKEDNSFLANLQKKLKDLKDQRSKFSNDVSSETISAVNQQIQEVEKQINDFEIKVGIKQAPESKSELQELEDKLKQIQDNQKTNKAIAGDTYIKQIQDLNEAIRLEKEKLGLIEKQTDKLDEQLAKTLSVSTQNQSSFQTSESSGGKLESYNDELAALKQQMDANDQLIAKLTEIKTKYEELGETGSEGYKKVSENLDKVNAKQGTLAVRITELEQKIKDLVDLSNVFNDIGSALKAVGSAFSALGDAFESPTLNVMGIIGQAIGTVALSFAKALTTCKSWVDWLVFGATGVATMASMISQIKSATSGYAQGGIISGGSHVGDHNLARVNSGEMILNGSQQRRLFDTLNGKDALGGGEAVASTVSWKIRGSDLYGTLRNYSKTVSKTGKVTGIQ